MRPSLLTRLVNGPFEDPALFIRFLFENRAILFDIGDIHALSTRDILKISHVFISHTHMDHFIGFDRLLRVFLGREKKLHLYGPQGFIQNIEGKLGAYQWNLVEQFANSFSLEVTEIRPDGLKSRIYHCGDRFQARQDIADRCYTSCLLKEPGFTVSAVLLDHRIPCLGFCIQETFHINIKKDALEALGLLPGPWIQFFKQSLFKKLPSETRIDVPDTKGIQRFTLGALSEKIAIISPGQKIAYVTDILYSPENIKKIVDLAQDADQIYIEAAFMEKDRYVARQKYHLTAQQAGSIAGLVGAKKVIPFHFSPRYTGEARLVEAEIMASFNRVREK